MHCQLKKKSRAPRIAVGDVVIIHDEQPRAMWKLGVIEELLIGADGENRAAVLRVSGQGRISKHLRRPVQRLYPIEMTVRTTEQNQGNPEPEQRRKPDNTTTEDNPEPDHDPPVRWRPRRTAALRARDRLMAQALDSEEDDC